MLNRWKSLWGRYFAKSLHMWLSGVTDIPAWLVSRRGAHSPLSDAVPWTTFKALRWLDRFAKPTHQVWEWGSGGSTVFLANRVGQLTSIEHDKGWHSDVAARLSELPHVDFRLLEPEVAPSSTGDVEAFGSGVPEYEGHSFREYVSAIDDVLLPALTSS